MGVGGTGRPSQALELLHEVGPQATGPQALGYMGAFHPHGRWSEGSVHCGHASPLLPSGSPTGAPTLPWGAPGG